MPQGKVAKGAELQAAGGSRGIESLPDGVLEHILGFLPAKEAVRTSVLARRWRHLWKSTTVLWVGSGYPKQAESMEGLRNFVNHLLLLRGGSPLEKCYFTFIDQLNSHDDVSHVNLWFRHVVMCKVHVLGLFNGGPWIQLDNLPLISQHLRRLELTGVQVHNSFLNFSNSPALNHLKLSDCQLSSVNKIVSESLKHLSIIFSTGSSDSRIRIYTPNVTSLCLEYFVGRTPILEGMPLLLEGSVKITGCCRDYCCTNANSFWTCDCESCDSSDSAANGSINCVLLRGLSEAKSLALRSESDRFIFKRDLRWCPVLTNLKNLLLNDYWYVPDDFHALACILEHSPVLEKLTFELHNMFSKHKVEIKLRVSPMKRSTAISEHLKIVEIKCEVADDRVFKIMNFLSAFDICFSFEMKTLE